MHNEIGHHPLIDASPQVVGFHSQPTPTSFFAQYDVVQYGIYLWVFGVSCPVYVLPHLLIAFHLLADRTK